MNQSPVVNLHASVDATEPKSLSITVWILVVAQMSAVLQQLWAVSIHGDTFNAIVAFILFLGAIGVYRRVRWGRRVALAFLWLIIFVTIGAISPFRAMDSVRAGIEPPSVVILVTLLLAASIFSLSCIHILGKNKERFRPRWF